MRFSVSYWRSRSRERAMRSSLSAMPLQHLHLRHLVGEQGVLGADPGLDLEDGLLVARSR